MLFFCVRLLGMLGGVMLFCFFSFLSHVACRTHTYAQGFEEIGILSVLPLEPTLPPRSPRDTIRWWAERHRPHSHTLKNQPPDRFNKFQNFEFRISNTLLYIECGGMLVLSSTVSLYYHNSSLLCSPPRREQEHLNTAFLLFSM